MHTAAHPFGELLDKLMADHGLTQTQLSEKLGYSQGWITAIRTGQKRPGWVTAQKIADTFPECNEIDVYRLIKDARRRYDDGEMRGYLDLAA